MKKFLISLAIILTIVILLYWRFPYALQTNDAKLNLLYSSIALCSLLTRIGDYPLSSIIKGFFVFIITTGLLFIGYSYKNEILNSQLMSKLIPSRPITTLGGDVVVSATDGGHFQVEAKINNYRILCLVDTGATSILVDQKDIANIGIDPQTLNYNIESSTANGVGYGAQITADNFQVGPIILNNVNIMVNKEPLGTCLLGMSFLRRLKKFSISNDQLIMTP
jgi:aspartyl protease family protein